MRKLTVKEITSQGESKRSFEVTQMVNTTIYRVGEKLVLAELQDLIDNHSIQVTIKGREPR